MDFCALMSKNVEKASRIVRSFKRLAVKKSTLTKVELNLKGVLESCTTEEALMSVDHPVKFEIECPDWLTVATYEGTLETIIMINDHEFH